MLSCILALIIFSGIQLGYNYTSNLLLLIFFIEHALLFVGGIKKYKEDFILMQENEIKNVELNHKLYSVTSLFKRFLLRAQESQDQRIKDDVVIYQKILG